MIEFSVNFLYITQMDAIDSTKDRDLLRMKNETTKKKNELISEKRKSND